MNATAELIDYIDPESWTVLPGIAARPMPELTIDGRKGVISGLRFGHSIHCVACRSSFKLYTDGGTITAGLEVTRKGKTVRWYQEHKLNCRRPALPEQCPRCGDDNHPFALHGIRHSSAVGPEEMEMLDRVWLSIRASEDPELIARADRTEQRYRPVGGTR